MNTPHYAEAIYQRSLQLPEQEALDFIDFLLQRYGSASAGDDAVLPHRDASTFIAAVAGIWGADVPDDIDDADLVADTPRDEL